MSQTRNPATHVASVLAVTPAVTPDDETILLVIAALESLNGIDEVGGD